MSGLQELAVQVLTSLGALLPFGFAFGAGIVAAVNPCGFAMLPAYLSLYLGTEEAGYEKRSGITSRRWTLCRYATAASSIVAAS